jgi:PTH1 family peptidyl-tRNA hydrolase
LRASGSAGGHNGLRSIIDHLGSGDFARLRIGIGAPVGDPLDRKSRTVGHVLGPFSAIEQPLLDQVLAEVIRGVALIRERGLERAGNQLNSFRALPEAS